MANPYPTWENKEQKSWRETLHHRAAEETGILAMYLELFSHGKDEDSGVLDEGDSGNPSFTTMTIV